MLNENDTNKYFIKNGKIYQSIWYQPNPTMCFRNLSTGIEEVWAVNCMIIQEFKELVEKE